MKFSVALLPWILLISLNAQASERDWKCLSAIQEELTRSNCVGKSHPVGGTQKEGSSGSFSCGFLHCKGEGKLVGTNYYSFQDRSSDQKSPTATFCVHVDGQTYAYTGMKAGSGRIVLPGIRDQVSPNHGAGVCRIPSPLGLHVAKNHLEQIVQMTQVKVQAKSPRLKAAGDAETLHCDDEVRTKIGAAAYTLGLKTIRKSQDVQWNQYLNVYASCRGIPEMKGFLDGVSAARAAASHLK